MRSIYLLERTTCNFYIIPYFNIQDENLRHKTFVYEGEMVTLSGDAGSSLLDDVFTLIKSHYSKKQSGYSAEKSTQTINDQQKNCASQENAQVSEKLPSSLNSGFERAFEVVLESLIQIYDTWHASDIFENLEHFCSRKLRRQLMDKKLCLPLLKT